MKSKILTVLATAALIIVYAAVVFGITLGILNVLVLISAKLAAFVVVFAGLCAISGLVLKVTDRIIIYPLRKWSEK